MTTLTTDTIANMPYKKLLQTLRWRLQGEGYYTALACLYHTEKHSMGVALKAGPLKDSDYDNIQYRKDGVTPEFEHQVRIALLAFLLKGVPDLEALLCVILMHDLMEDYDVDKIAVTSVLMNAQKLKQPKLSQQECQEFTDKVFNAVWAMTKKYRGVAKSTAEVFAAIANDPLASLAKGLDRIQNFQSMVGPFKLAKRKSYIQEAFDLFFPMLKQARKQFSHQMDAYLLIETIMKYQVELIRIINDTDRVIALNSEGVTK